MKFSYNWIRDCVDGLDVPAEALERLITTKTAECEGVEHVGVLLAGATLARVESVEPVQGSNHLSKAIVDAGKYGKKTVICGAPNCRQGITTIYVPLGVKTIAGVASDGMLASASELEIAKDHAGILELSDSQEMPQPDSVIEIDNKSITHRPDLWGHYGMAREVAAITGKALRDPVKADLLPPAESAAIQIEIDDLALCPRYSALVFENVTVRPSPLWLQARLTAIGLNPINNIVDVTNFIMAELAQPMHAFDRAKLSGNTIRIRPAVQGERIKALNKEEYALTQANLVIADASGAVAIAGVIGGDDSAISDSTTSIVFESANFNAASVRKTSAALKLRTDASMRFEKAQDPETTVRGLARALELLPLVSPGIRLLGGLADRRAQPKPQSSIALSMDWLARKLGMRLEISDVRRILESLQFGCHERDAKTLTVSVPSWRATKDIALPEDLVEEVGRMIGYESITPVPPLVPCAPAYDPPERDFLRTVKRAIAAQGFTEVSNYSFISEEEARRFGFAVEDHVRVLNPIAAGQDLMRTSLLPGIYRNILENAKHFDEFRIFESGHEIHKGSSATPDEAPHLMAAIYSKGEGVAEFLELKRVAECLAHGAHVRPVDPRVWEHPTRCAAIAWNGKEIGRIGELHPSLLEGGRAAVLDLDLTLLRQLAPDRARYVRVRRFPTSAFDLSIIARERELAADLELEIRRFGGEWTESVEYVREYRGAPLPDGMKSVSFRVVVGGDKTLSSDEIAAIRNGIVEGLKSLGYELRA
ncbi:MAG TPA: phenylalanine--tRNA ligase subunit beta [Bryobacteraceae bacterium]|nr:phenylalanine--tRNA ligase subunit beta [Bryobacteraceae bacterium]